MNRKKKNLRSILSIWMALNILSSNVIPVYANQGAGVSQNAVYDMEAEVAEKGAESTDFAQDKNQEGIQEGAEELPETEVGIGTEADTEVHMEESNKETFSEDAKEDALSESTVAETEAELLGFAALDYPNADPSYKSGPYYQRLLNVNLTGNQRDDIVAIAQSQIGYMEGVNKNDISGTSNKHNNYTEYGNYIVGSGGKGYAWCAMYISWCAAHAGIPTNVIKHSTTASASGFGVQFYKRGQYTPQKGDLIFFDYPNNKYNWDHVELVTGVDSKKVYTVGGNTGNNTDRVMSKSYKLSYSSIKGYGVPNYANNPARCEAPKLSCTDAEAGKDITISAPGCDAVYYTVDDGAQQQYTDAVHFTSGTHTIRAYAVKAGYMPSNTITMTFGVPKAPAPVLTRQEDAHGASVSLAADIPSERIYYSLNGGAYSLYTNTFTITATSTIQYYGRVNGYGDSDTQRQTIEISKPGTPALSLQNTSSRIAVGESAILTWSSIANATGYKLKVYRNSVLEEEMETEGASAAIPLEDQGTYEFEVMAFNRFGNSGYSNRTSIEAMPDVTVQFQDWDGSPLTEIYTIKYGASVEPPKSPSRLGYDFQGWQGSYTNVTKNTVIKAKYDKKAFTVIFCDQDGTTLSRQRVEWDDAATAPDVSDRIPFGFVFTGWNVDPKESDWEDYTKVEGRIKLYAAYAWENENLPVTIRSLSSTCTYNTAGQYYKTDMTLYCTPSTDIRGRIIVEIQTAKGTTVAVGMQDITLEAGNQEIKKSVQINSTADGTIANVYVVGIDEKENTAGAYSKMASTEVQREIFYSEWSDWSETPVSATDHIQVETKKQYRYNTLQTATSTTSKTMSGYTLIATTPHVGNWSGWQSSAVGSVTSDALYREVQTQNVLTSTSYEYGHYCTGNVSGAKYMTAASNNTSNSTFNSRCTYHSLGTFDSNDSRFQYSDGDYLYYPNGSKYSCANKCWRWYRMNTYNSYNTQYRYRDTTYEYKFQKVSNWSAWSDTAPSGSYNQKQERTLYRYRTVTDANTPAEVEQEQTHLVSGTIKDTDSDLSGKLATVLVYKRTNEDPTQNQMEYVDQILIGEGNTYAINVIPKEALSDKTGDYIVALAVEGATRLVNVDTIHAPKPEYTVTFIAEGQVLSEQKVNRNENASIPNAPQIGGKRFERWDASASNITEDMAIYAVYTQQQYTVVYIDELGGTVEIKRADYNDPITAEAQSAPEGYTFKGWDAEVVTGDMIVRAVYEKAEYTVQFKDAEDNTISSQTVAYGASALPPDTQYITAPSGTKIYGWSKEMTWWNVTGDMIVYPIISYESTTEMPYTDTDLEMLYVAGQDDAADRKPEENQSGDGYLPSAEQSISESAVSLTNEQERDESVSSMTEEAKSESVSGNTTGGQKDTEEQTMDEIGESVISLSCNTVGAQIYYTLNGNDPLTEENTEQGTVLYTEPIEVTENMELRACAVAPGKNVSEIFALQISPDSSEYPSELSKDDSHVDITGLKISQKSAAIEAQQKLQLSVSALPQNATDQTVVWTTSDIHVAAVDANGMVTGDAAGVCTITATSVDNSSVKAECTITVRAKNIEDNQNVIKPAEGTYKEQKAASVKISLITITGLSKKLAAGKSMQLAVNISPQNAADKSVRWYSSNTSYATVSASGKVTAKAKGAGKSVIMTAIAKDGSGVKAVYKLQIMKNAVTKITLTKDGRTLKNGKTITAKTGKSVKPKATIKTTNKKGKVKNAFVANKALKWTSSNTQYASVKSGKITLKKAGKGKTVTITAMATDGSGKKASVKIKIK